MADWTLVEDVAKLEESENMLTRQIEEKQDEIRRTSRRLIDAKGEVERIQHALLDVDQRIRRMRGEYKIVLLSEYEQCLKLREYNTRLLTERRDEINRLVAMGKKASKLLPSLNAQLAQVKARLAAIDEKMAGYGKVLEFRR